jgi:hypothetical protein
MPGEIMPPSSLIRLSLNAFLMTPRILAVLGLSLFLTACDPPKKSAPSAVVTAPPDTPILPVSVGDSWTYDVHLSIPADVTSPGAAEVDETYQRVRTYLGKISAAVGLPAVDCFEVTAPVTATEREFVEISNDRILMRGSMLMRPETTQPMWLSHPVPFVIAGMKPGTESPELQTQGGGLSRKTYVVSREDLTTQVGTFHTIHLLTTGQDGDIELRHSIWFAPGSGIIREEKTRTRHGQLLYQEEQSLSGRFKDGKGTRASIPQRLDLPR